MYAMARKVVKPATTSTLGFLLLPALARGRHQNISHPSNNNLNITPQVAVLGIMEACKVSLKPSN
jgi:hypothetical protein